MLAAALGAILASAFGALLPAWLSYAFCAASLLLCSFLFHRRNRAFLLPLFLLLVLFRMFLLPESLPSDSAAGMFLDRLRGGMKDAASVLYRDQAGVAVGMLLGGTEGLTDALREQFKGVGFLHLFAVSGLHVSLLTEMLGRFARTRNKAVSFMILTLFLLFFCAVTGFSASVLRAAFMLIGVRISRMRERQVDMPSVFCFAMALTLLCDPMSLFHAGFQLSFGAAGGMILFAKTLRKPFARRFPQSKILTALTSTAAALIGMLPIMAYRFGEVTFLSIPLSVLLIPTMPIILLFGFFSILLYGIMPHVAVLLSYPAYGAIRVLTQVSEWINVPLLSLPKPHPIAIVLYYAGLLFASRLYLKNADRPPWIGIGLLFVSLILWCVL